MKTPRPYQVTAIQLALARNALIADVCGLGKTLDAVCAARLFVGGMHGIRRILIVCPLRVRLQWVEEIRDQNPEAKVFVIDPGLPLDLQIPEKPKPSGWYIVYYEGLARSAKDLRPIVWDVIIADEAHRLKNRKTRWTIQLKTLTAIRKIALTATPQEKGPQDLWSPGNWLYPDVFTSYWKFFDHYVDVDEFTNRPKGIKNEKQLASVLARFMLRRTKEQVEPDLPPRIMQTVDVPMTLVQQKIYNEVSKSRDLTVKVEGQTPILLIENVLTHIVRLQQISSWPPLLDFTSSSGKVNWVLDWLNDNPQEVVVIFCKFRGTVDALVRSIGKTKLEVVVGGVQSVPERFVKGEVNILVGTIAAMGEGLNLQRADVALFVDQEWSTIKMTQAIDRIHRIGITGPKLVYYLRSTKTDDLVLRAIEKKWTETELVYAAIEEWKAQSK
jgi:SNF2 family DNA or RNA helicase